MRVAAQCWCHLGNSGIVDWARGALLMADGVFGLRIFPQFLSTARRPEEESLPEQMLYSFGLTRVRYCLILVFVVAAMLGLERFGKADWLLWSFLGSLAVH